MSSSVEETSITLDAYTSDNEKDKPEAWDFSVSSASTDFFEFYISDVSNGITHSSVLSDDAIRRKIQRYEKKFGMSSEEFMEKWRAGEAPDTFETNLWASLLKHDSNLL
jgi:hypothetical protein